MKRILIVMEGDPEQRYGVFNAVVSRATHLRAVAPEWQVDVAMVAFHDGVLARRLRGSHLAAARPSVISADGVDITVHWFERSLLDGLAHRLWGGRPRRYEHWCRRLAATLPPYDLVSAHDLLGGLAGRAVARLRHIPLCVTWHGASINTTPWHDKMIRSLTIELLKEARVNYSVSRAQAQRAKLLLPSCEMTILYNGSHPAFKPCGAERKRALRQQHGVNPGVKLVVFLGRHDEDKQALLLPPIFAAIAAGYRGAVQFWTIGDGPQQALVGQMMRQASLNCRMWGRCPSKDIPDLLSCADLLVLPSRMEGLPLVAIEALACGVNVVSSNVGGCPEVVGTANVVNLGDGFVTRMARRCLDVLLHPAAQPLPEAISWEHSAQIEKNVYTTLLNQTSTI